MVQITIPPKMGGITDNLITSNSATNALGIGLEYFALEIEMYLLSNFLVFNVFIVKNCTKSNVIYIVLYYVYMYGYVQDNIKYWE